MSRRAGRRLLPVILFLGVLPVALSQAPPAPTEPRQLDVVAATGKVFTDGFDAMLERRVIRFVVPYSRTLYFNDKGRERGIAADTVRDFERWINEKYRAGLGKRPITVLIIPATRDLLLESVTSGRADVAAGNITATDARLALVDFVAPPRRTRTCWRC